MSGDTITIFDTTLRDGEQSPGCSMTTDEKLEVAKALVELGVDVIEAGFPIASPGDFEAVQRISREFGSQTKICGLARCRKEDIDRAAEALKDAEKARMHVFLATSAIHREHKLKMTGHLLREAQTIGRALDLDVHQLGPGYLGTDGAEILLRRLPCLVTAAKHGGSFKIASKFEELPADDAISEIPEEMLTEVYTRIKLEEKLESYRTK